MIKVPAGAQAPAQAPAQALKLCQPAVPDLQLFNSSFQVVGELRQLLHGPNVLHEDLLLEEEEKEGTRGYTESTKNLCSFVQKSYICVITM